MRIWDRLRNAATNPLRNFATAAECEGNNPFLLSGTPSPSCTRERESVSLENTLCYDTGEQERTQLTSTNLGKPLPGSLTRTKAHMTLPSTNSSSSSSNPPEPVS